MNRPQRNDKNVRHLAASMLVARLKTSHPDIFDDCEDDDVHADLLRAIDHDGYRMARQLESNGWDVDAGLVEELHGGCLFEAYDELVEKWIGWHGHKPKLTEGAKVIVHPDVFNKGLLKQSEGEIVAVDLKRGTYTVYVPAWGHVKKGTLGTQGCIYDWEVVEGWQTAEAAVATEVAK